MNYQSFPSVVDFAYQVIDMHQRIQELEAKVAYLQDCRDMLSESVNDSMKNTDKLFGIMLAGALRDIETAKAIADL